MSFASYEIARSGLTVNERGLYVTGHNIANVNTPGYVRQQAMIKNGPVNTVLTRGGLMQVGLGADIQEIRQIRNTFLDNMYRKENSALGYWETRQKTFIDLQAILGEPMESGLQNILNQFWDAWQELAKEPDSLTVRALVRQRSEALVQYVNHLGEQLDRLQNDLNNEIAVRIGEINEITREIAELNVTILKNEVSGDTAADYRDQRNKLIDRLTRLADVNVIEMQDGQVDITLGGYFLVQRGISTDLYAEERNPGDIFYVAKLAGTDIEVPVKSGILKGLMESRGEIPVSGGVTSEDTMNIVSDVKNKLNTLISVMLNEINNLHKSGMNIKDPPEYGEDIFVAINPAKPLQMGNITLNPNLSDLSVIAASKTGMAGDNTIALEIANLRNKALIMSKTGLVSIDDYYQYIILTVGNKASEAVNITGSQQNLVQAIDMQRTAIAGVSMDEEMTNMLKFKFAYDAASRVLNIIDSMMETIVNRMGLTGR